MIKQIEINTTTWDWKFTNGRLNFITGASRVAQHNRQSLQTFYNEYFLNILIGIPYFEYFFVKSPDVNRMTGYIRQAIFDDPEVATINTLELDIDTERISRKAAVTYTATMTDGEVIADTLVEVNI